MKIDLSEIKDVIKEGNLRKLSRETGIPLRTLEDWRYNNNKWLQQAEERLTAIQNYVNEERTKMKYAVVVNLEDKNGRRIDVNFDALVAVENSIEDVEKFIDDDKDSSSYNKAEKITYAIYEVNDEILEDENDEFGDILEMGTNITYEITKDLDGEFNVINGINPENEYTVENLMFTTYYKGDNSIDLEFDINNRPVIVRVEAPEGSFTDEDYFDSQENLDKALENRL